MIVSLIAFVFNVFQLLIIARALSSFVQVDPYNPIMRFLYNTTEPFLAPTRNFIAPYTRNLNLDLSPIVVLIAAAIIEQILLRVIIG